MKILIYGINYAPELTGIGKYSGEMSQWLKCHGHEVRAITAQPYYPEWEIHEGFKNKYSTKDELGVKVFRCPLYVPKHLSAIKRLAHLSSFALTSFFPLIAQKKWKPEIIITIAPTLFCVPGMYILSKLTGAHTILHIQDYEIDAMLGLGMVKSRFVSMAALKFEKWCLKRVDYISTISYSMINKAISKDIPQRKILLFPNWSEVERFSQVNKNDAAAFKENLGIPVHKKVILYAGNIGEKQGLEIVIDIANEFTSHEFQFLFVGHGSGKEKLKKMVVDRNISNVMFIPLQSYENLPVMLSMADCHLVIQKKGAADAVMPSKLTNILAVGGNAVITAEPETELGQLCLRYPGIAICVDPESKEALKLGIITSLNLESPNITAKKYALELLDKNAILNNFINSINNFIFK